MRIDEHPDGTVIITHIDPLQLKLFNFLPKGGYVIKEAKLRGLRLGFNGGFFHYSKTKGFTVEGRVIYRGKVVFSRPLPTNWAYLLCVYKNGVLSLTKFNLYFAKSVRDVHMCIEAGPRLVANGSVVSGLDDRIKASRLALGWDKKGLMMVGFVRDKVTLREFAVRMKNAGGVFVLNLDGGGSASLYYNENGVERRFTGVPTHPYDVIKYAYSEYGRLVPYMIGVE